MMDTEQVKLNQTRSILSNLICCRQMKMDGQMRVDEIDLKLFQKAAHFQQI